MRLFRLSSILFGVLSSTSLLAQSSPTLFAPAIVYSSGARCAASASTADVNGDGALDIIVANYGGCYGIRGSIGVLLGNGDATFQSAFTYDAGGYDATSVAVADVNGDGKLDIVVANYIGNGDQDGTVGVLLGNGDGTFEPAATYRSGGAPVYVSVGDLNGDGKLDLIVANFYASGSGAIPGSVGVLLGNGDGTFRSPMTYGSGGAYASWVAVADINGDAKPDLLVAAVCAASNDCNGLVGVLLGNGDGTFQPAVTYGSGGFQSASVGVADVNGDGKPDLLIANDCEGNQCNNGTVGVLINNGDGTFQAAASYGTGGYYPVSAVVADVNGDGKTDIIAANFRLNYRGTGDGLVGVLLGNGDGTFQAPVTYDSGGVEPHSVAVADVNSDGKPDLVLANWCSDGTTCANGLVSVLLNISPSPYKAFVQRPISSDGTSIFNANRGVIPVKFTLFQNGTLTCTLPPATIAVSRTAGGVVGSVLQDTYSMSADNGSNFRIDENSCNYVYNLAASSLGVGTYRVDILIRNATSVGTAVFALK